MSSSTTTVLLVLLMSTATPPSFSASKRATKEGDNSTCTYNTWSWDTRLKKSVAHNRVRKPRSLLSPEERDRHSPCTVCEEDQKLIRLAGVEEFRICREYAERIEHTLRKALAEDFPIREIVGYRVGRTKGAIDSHGRRTEFSNHSFGTALDINPHANGLYDNCPAFSPQCRLIRGGPWRTNSVEAISSGTSIYRAFRSMGWKWGGELEGKQKDFMHFSLHGD